MSNAETNEAAVRRFVDEVKNERKLERMGEFFADDYVEHNKTVASFGKPGVDAYKNFLAHLFGAFPDDVVKIDVIVASGDLVGYWATESGTHKGEFLGIPATGKSATWTEVQFFRFEGGKCVEHWISPDVFDWFTQLGIIPAMGEN